MAVALRRVPSRHTLVVVPQGVIRIPSCRVFKLSFSNTRNLLRHGYLAVTVSLLLFASPGWSQQIDPDHPAYADIEREPSRGNQHVNGTVNYGAEFPTSGSHSTSPVPPGLYDEMFPRERLVHSLEHGNVVIYYDTPGDVAIKFFERWADAYQGGLDGVVIVRRDGLGERTVLTAWQNRLVLDKFDVRASLFVDAFRGRGPERRVR